MDGTRFISDWNTLVLRHSIAEVSNVLDSVRLFYLIYRGTI